MTPSSLTAPDNSSFRLSLSVVLVATIVRIIVIVFMGEGLHRDPDAYRKIAENLRETGTFGFRVTDRAEPASGLGRPGPSVVRPTAYRPPLYPLLLAPLVFNGELWVAGVAILHVIGGVGTVWLVGQLGRQWGLGRSAWWGALAVALDPILVFQTAQLMTETLATLCGVVGLSGLTRWLDRRRSRDAFLAGMAMGLACLCRPTFLPWSGVAILAAAMATPPTPRSSPSGWAPRARAAGWMALGLAVCLLPWGARNYLQLGTTKLTTTHGGYTLLLGNNPEFYAFLREADWGAIWDSRRLDRAWLRRDELAGPADDLFSLAGEPMTASVPPQPAMHRCTRTEIEDDQLAYALARRYIREDRPMFIWASLHRIASLWHLLPHATVTPEPTWRTLLRWSTAAWYGALFGLVVVGMVRLRGRLLRLPWLWGLLLTLTFTAVHAIYWSNLRMRAPLMPVLALVAAAAVASGPSRGERGRAETAPSSSADPD